MTRISSDADFESNILFDKKNNSHFFSDTLYVCIIDFSESNVTIITKRISNIEYGRE